MTARVTQFEQEHRNLWQALIRQQKLLNEQEELIVGLQKWGERLGPALDNTLAQRTDSASTIRSRRLVPISQNLRDKRPNTA